VQSLRSGLSLWEDLDEVLFDIVPDTCFTIRQFDQWFERPEKYDERRRTLEFISNTDDQTVFNLCEDTSLAASGDGWLMVEEDENSCLYTLDRGDEVLLVSRTAAGSVNLDFDTMRIEIRQPWPSDVHPPVSSSTTFIEVCQNVLKIHEFPILLEKDLIFERPGDKRARWMQERIQYRGNEDVRSRVRRAGYIPSPKNDFVWNQTTEDNEHCLRACVIFDDRNATVELTLIKEAKLVSKHS